MKKHNNEQAAAPSPLNVEGHTPGKVWSVEDVVMVEVNKNTYWLAQCHSPCSKDTSKNGKEEARANAAHIAKCWNESDTLLKENEQLKEQVRVLREALLGLMGRCERTIKGTDNFKMRHSNEFRECLQALSQTETKVN